MDHWNAVDILEKIWQESAKLFCCVKKILPNISELYNGCMHPMKNVSLYFKHKNYHRKKGKTHNINGKFKKKKSDTSYGPYSEIIIPVL